MAVGLLIRGAGAAIRGIGKAIKKSGDAVLKNRVDKARTKTRRFKDAQEVGIFPKNKKKKK